MILGFGSLKSLKGVDGYAIYDETLNLIENSIPEKYMMGDLSQLIAEILPNNSLFNPFREKFGSPYDLIMLTEKGVLQISKIRSGYLFVLGGNQESIDVVGLSELVNEMKKY
jgi:hypothetical protein